ncbi:MAG: hypothetical protein ACOC97_00185 [Myxococcota bacterium]
MGRPLTAVRALRWIALGVGLFGCAGGEPAQEPSASAGGEVAAGEEPAPPPVPEPLRLLPSDAFAVVEIDMDRLRASDYHDRVATWLLGQLSPHPERREVGRDVLSRTRRIVIGVLPPGADGADPEAVVAARGDYDPELLARFMQQAGNPVAEVHTIAGHRVYVEKDVWAAEIPGPTWVFASAGWIRALLEKTAPGMEDPSPLDRDELRAMAHRVGFGEAPVTAVAEVLPEVRAELGDGRWLARETGQALREAGLRLELDDGATARVIVQTDDRASAQRLATRVGELIRWGGANVFVSMLGLRPVFEATEIRAEGSTAVLTVHLEDVQVRRLLARLEAMAGQVLQEQGVELRIDEGP